MLKVSNHRPIRRLAFRIIKANKNKNIAVIAAIVLTTVMFTALFSIGVSINETTQRSTMHQVGSRQMAELKYVNQNDYNTLSKDSAVRDISYRILVGAADNKELHTLQTEICYSEEDNARESFSYPETGRMPEAKNEVALSSLTLAKLGVEQKLGEKVSLKLRIDDKEYNQDLTLCGFWDGDEAAKMQMGYISKRLQEELAPTPAYEYNESNANSLAGYWIISVNYGNSFDIEGKTTELLARNGYDLEKAQYGVNWAYSFSDIDAQSVIIMVFVLVVILLSGYLIIFNIFNINIAADIHSYGLLKTIGTSKRQLKRIVRIQALYLSMLGIPVGLLAGTLTSRIVFPSIVRVMSLSETDMVISIHPLIYAAAVLFSVLTVLAGCRKACRTAGRVTPIEALTYMEYTSTGRQTRRSRRVTMIHLAFSNLRNDKRKVCVVVLSLTMSILLVNGVFTVVQSMDADKYLSMCVVGDFCIQNEDIGNPSANSGSDCMVGTTDMEYLKNLDGVSRQSNVYCDRHAHVAVNDKAKTMLEKLLATNDDAGYMDDVRQAHNEGQLPYEVYGVDNLVLDKIDVIEGSFDAESFAAGNYALIYSSQMIGTDGDDDSFNAYEPGEMIDVRLDSGITKSYKIMAVANLPYAVTTKRFSTVGGKIIIPEAEYLANEEDNGALVSILMSDANKKAALENELQRYVDSTESLSLVSRQSNMKIYDGLIRMISILGGSLAGLLALIGILNFTNTVITGIMRRYKVFAMMEAVGMTRHQLVTMLVCEGMIYGLFTVLFALVIHFLVGGPLVSTIAGKVWFFSYCGTILPIFMCFLIILIMALLIPLMAAGKLEKDSVVDRMRI